MGFASPYSAGAPVSAPTCETCVAAPPNKLLLGQNLVGEKAAVWGLLAVPLVHVVFLLDPKTRARQDPDGGSWPAYPSGKSWDEASGKTGSGKTRGQDSGGCGVFWGTQSPNWRNSWFFGFP